MDVFLLGAGRPARGDTPSALKKITVNTRALDWQIHSFDQVEEPLKFHYLGGYNVAEVIDLYPTLHVTVIPDWEHHSILHTLLQAPHSQQPVVISYSDTIFRHQTIADLVTHSADVVFAVDSQWQQRYDNRSLHDINLAEKILLNEFDCHREGIAEFTGLVYLSAAAAEFVFSLRESQIGKNLLDLIKHLKHKGFTVEMHDVAGSWAEFNSPADIAHFILGTKAETLARLEGLVKKSHIGKQVSFTQSQWQDQPAELIKRVQGEFKNTKLVVRSSAKSEDNWDASNAGGFESLLNIDATNKHAITSAVNSVINSYGGKSSRDDQVLLQEFVTNVKLSGVVFTCGLETGSPYYRINFDDQSQSTESVTAGSSNDLRTVIVNRHNSQHISSVEPALLNVIQAVKEIEELLSFDKLDIEFAIEQSGRIHIFQVRPITVDHSAFEVNDEALLNSLQKNIERFTSQQKSSHLVYGKTNIFGNMPDWNPAEIIGARPKPLAFSLYRHLITNEIWATQRSEFGYRDVRPYPLILSFSGQPYVDVRVSLNSFIPASLPESLADKLANAYLDILHRNPQLHDKIEFEVAFTIWTPGFQKEAKCRLANYAISDSEINQLETALKEINCRAFCRLSKDIQPIEELQRRRLALEQSPLPNIDHIYALLDDCRRYGTLAFSHAARAGFVATALLKSFVAEDIISDQRRQDFMQSVRTVASEFEEHKYQHSIGTLSEQSLLNTYSHLRPGTYELEAQAYWEAPEVYLRYDSSQKPKATPSFTFTREESNKVQVQLREMGADLSSRDLVIYLRDAITAREAVKFAFTRNLSQALDTCIQLGKTLELDRSDVSFMTYHDLEELKLNAVSVETIRSRIKQRKRDYSLTQLIELPSLIADEADFFCFERHASQPNFVTTQCVEAKVNLLEGTESENISGQIVLIPKADPGYDWLFGHNIAGLITQYGGANSHMAIRAAETNLPAAIGVGEKLYERTAKMSRVQLDCANKVLRELQ
ncbi:MAG: choline kinase [Flavobacteriales bacterium]|jgi:choline kinase